MRHVRWSIRGAAIAATAALLGAGLVSTAQPAVAATCTVNRLSPEGGYSLCTPVIPLMQHRVVLACLAGPTATNKYGPWKPYGVKSHAYCSGSRALTLTVQKRSMTCGPVGEATVDDSVTC